MREYSTLAALLLLGISCLSQDSNPPLKPVKSDSSASAPPLKFRDIAAEAGLTTTPSFSTDKHYLFETSGGGIALFDCDNDGKLDIVVVNDSTVERLQHGGDPMVTLYRQSSNLQFSDVTEKAGLTAHGWGLGIAVGDFDNDGLPDLYVTGYGHNVLYRNLGGCKFEDVTAHANVAGSGFSIGAAWADYDHDGLLDLFVSRYVNSDIQHLPHKGAKSFDYKGLPLEVPDPLEGVSVFLFHNRGDGTFEEVSQRAGLGNAEKRHEMGVTWADYDHDGWDDLFVAVDSGGGGNYLYHNRHDGTFEDVGLFSGVALSLEGKVMGNMAGEFGDLIHDGNLDLVVTRFGAQPMSFYVNQGTKGFTDLTYPAKIGQTSLVPVKWGVGVSDFDNDGWPDIFEVNGNIARAVDGLPGEAKYREPIQLFRNNGDYTFSEMAAGAGLNDGALHSRRGAAFGDVDNDGSIDVVTFNMEGPPSLFLNQTRNSNHRVLLRLVGTKSNRSAIGARVSVYTSKMTQVDEVRAGGSYLSTNDPRLHFGLGSDDTIKKLVIEWPSGLRQELKDVKGDAIYTIVEGEGIKNTSDLPSLPLR
jgi:enediyne biosynthesis protein E4